MTRKRKGDGDDAVFDVDAEREKVRCARTKKARKAIPQLFAKIDTLLAETRDCMARALAPEHDAPTYDRYAEGYMRFDQDYSECMVRLMDLERAVASLQQALPDATMRGQRVCAVDQFRLLDDDLDTGTKRRPSIILADPPWTSDNPSYLIGTRTQYDTMTDAQLCTMPVAGLANEDCALLLWTTLPKLATAFRVMRAWGFEYKTVFLIWVKIEKYMARLRMTCGSFTRPNAEIILIGTRGNMRTGERKSFRHCNVLLTRTQEHSRKPEVMKQIAVELFGDQPRIELFSRATTLDWRSWGNEVGLFASALAPLNGSADGGDADAASSSSSSDSDGSPDTLPPQAARVQSEPESARHASQKKRRRNKMGSGAFANATDRRLTAMAQRSLDVAPVRDKHNTSLKASAKTLGFYTPHNCMPKNQFIHYADGADEYQRETARAAYLHHLQSRSAGGDDDTAYSPPLRNFVTPYDLATNRRITEYESEAAKSARDARSRHPLYTQLTNAEVAQNLPLIHATQARNSDTLFAFNNNKKKRPVRFFAQRK